MRVILASKMRRALTQDGLAAQQTYSKTSIGKLGMRWILKWPSFGIGKNLTNGYLLDSNSFLWCISNQKKLGVRAQKLIESFARTYFSAVSVAEVAIKESLGRPVLPHDFEERAIGEDLFELKYESSDAKEVPRFLSLIGHDPFDRLILAQAAARGLKLVTADRKLLDLGFDRILDARL